MTQSDEDLLVQRVKECGDHVAFTTLYNQNKKIVFIVCLRLLKNADDAEDAVQETFFKAWKAIKQFKGRAAFCTWLCRIAMNHVRDGRRRTWREWSLEEIMEDTDADVIFEIPAKDHGLEQCVEIAELRAAIEKLSPIDQRIITLYLYGYRDEEIASAMQRTVGGCKSGRSRAIKKLRTAYASA